MRPTTSPAGQDGPGRGSRRTAPARSPAHERRHGSADAGAGIVKTFSVVNVQMRSVLRSSAHELSRDYLAGCCIPGGGVNPWGGGAAYAEGG
jgi:hypothetical protein